MAAGLGFKTFQTGEVLTAADTNGYLMQGVLVFANAAARDAAITSPQEGQCCYLKDTDAVLTYSGTAWVGFDDSNAIQNAIINAKGDLIAGSANDTPAILSAGANGETLVADSSATTGLRWQGNFAAGKNKIINGDFAINQRNLFTASNPAGSVLADRFVIINYLSGTNTATIETFTVGTAPVAGYEAKYFFRMANSGATGTDTQSVLLQRIESVRTLAGQTVTISFWAKANTGTPKIAVEIDQQFGTGGSPSSRVTTYAGQVTLSTSWARYSVTVAVPSISGKTLGTNNNDYVGLILWTSAGSDFNARTGSLGIQNSTFDFWGIQVEEGSVATAFQTATGTLAGELAACQRYYWRSNSGLTYTALSNVGTAVSTTQAIVTLPQKVSLRATPTVIDYGNLGLSADGLASAAIAVSAAAFSNANITSAEVQNILLTATGLTQYRPYALYANNNTAGFIAIGAEL